MKTAAATALVNYSFSVRDQDTFEKSHDKPVCISEPC